MENTNEVFFVDDRAYDLAPRTEETEISSVGHLEFCKVFDTFEDNRDRRAYMDSDRDSEVGFDVKYC